MISTWMLRVVIIFAAVGVILFDAGSIAVNFFTLDSKADEIAIVLSTRITNGELNGASPVEVTRAADELATEAGARLVKAEVASDGGITVRIRRRADTLAIGRVKQLDDWVKATADSRAGSS
jgi:hypothetical protein